MTHPDTDVEPVEVLPAMGSQPLFDAGHRFVSGFKSHAGWFAAGIALGITLALVLHLKINKR